MLQLLRFVKNNKDQHRRKSKTVPDLTKNVHLVKDDK